MLTARWLVPWEWARCTLAQTKNIFLIVLTFVSPSGFFLILAACSLLLLALVVYLEEPKSVMNQILPDGTVISIELN